MLSLLFSFMLSLEVRSDGLMSTEVASFRGEEDPAVVAASGGNVVALFVAAALLLLLLFLLFL